MQIIYDYETIPITKEEYEENKYKRKNDSILERIIEMSDIYYKVPIYEGLQSAIDGEPKYYKYYKRGKYKPYFICGYNIIKFFNKVYGNI